MSCYYNPFNLPRQIYPRFLSSTQDHSLFTNRSLISFREHVNILTKWTCFNNLCIPFNVEFFTSKNIILNCARKYPWILRSIGNTSVNVYSSCFSWQLSKYSMNKGRLELKSGVIAKWIRKHNFNCIPCPKQRIQSELLVCQVELPSMHSIQPGDHLYSNVQWSFWY